ncbi:MAG TPA: sigma-70 family RNA polymerase sigma factor, partial [Pyrinomonadaceae bacterium]|nr:sigma-70 family RNA polymerase sigma factor [Pyrinomonadaceae bacterium]
MPDLTFGPEGERASLLASFDNPCERVTCRFNRSSRKAVPKNPSVAHANKGQVTAAETEKTQTTDYALAQKAASGDMQSFEQLYQRHNRRVYSLCLRMTQNVSEAEDLAQEVFIQLFRKIGSFRGESAFTTWLHRLTVNQVLMHFRKRSVRDE